MKKACKIFETLYRVSDLFRMSVLCARCDSARLKRAFRSKSSDHHWRLRSGSWQGQRQLWDVDSSTRAAFKSSADLSKYFHYSTPVSHPRQTQTNAMASLSSYNNALVLLPPASIAERIAPFRYVHDKV